MSNPNPKERWSSRLGVILVVASCAIGLGNFLRFPGQAAKNGGGAFMIPYLVGFVFLGIPVCLSEWVMGRIGGKRGHSSRAIFSAFLPDGFALRISSAIAIIIPTLIYVYYVFIESWCLAYAVDFFSRAGQAANHGMDIKQVVADSGLRFETMTGAKANGAALGSSIIWFLIFCYLLNYFIVYRGIAKGLEKLAKIAAPILFICSSVLLFRVLSLDGIMNGLGKMWNPDWNALAKADVWVAAAGQIFFSLSVGFGIVLVFTSYLTENDDVTLSGLTAASLNEFVEIVFGGMITIPVWFLFLAGSSSDFSTFSLGFTALPAIFSQMPFGNIFAGIWFTTLFIAAITSSVTMLQPAINFLEEDFHLHRRYSSAILFIFTSTLTAGIVYYSRDLLALDYTDFWVGTMLIYILATIQVIIYGWVIGPKKGREESEKGALWSIPKTFDFVIKYITPVILILILAVFISQNLTEYINKMSPEYMQMNAAKYKMTPAEAYENAVVARSVFFVILGILGMTFVMVHFGIRKNRSAHE
ncbi:MAG TPA: sodium-dependent transporter [Leptospiraceae bacterium]|nr:sodium-dependent transporter [Leptospiraceae bacterium]